MEKDRRIDRIAQRRDDLDGVAAVVPMLRGVMRKLEEGDDVDAPRARAIVVEHISQLLVAACGKAASDAPSPAPP